MLQLSFSLFLNRRISRFPFSDSYISEVIHGNAQRGQRYEQFANSLSEARTLDRLSGQPSWRAGPFRFFRSVPSFHRIPSPGKTCRLIFFPYFYIKRRRLSHIARYTPSRISSIYFRTLPLTSCIPFPSEILSFSLAFCNRSTRNCARYKQPLRVRN